MGCAALGLGRCCSSVTERWRLCSFVAPSPRPNSAQRMSSYLCLRPLSGRDPECRSGARSVSRNGAGVRPAFDLLALAHINSLLGDLVTLNSLFVLQNCVLGLTPFSIGPGQ